MILKVGQDGLLIPSDLLAGIDEVRLWKEDDRIVLQPIASSPGGVERPSIFDRLGSEPIDCGPADSSERHDFYLYGDPHCQGEG